jgi:hypothetical protein
MQQPDRSVVQRAFETNRARGHFEPVRLDPAAVQKREQPVAVEARNALAPAASFESPEFTPVATTSAVKPVNDATLRPLSGSSTIGSRVHHRFQRRAGHIHRDRGSLFRHARRHVAHCDPDFRAPAVVDFEHDAAVFKCMKSGLLCAQLVLASGIDGKEKSSCRSSPPCGPARYNGEHDSRSGDRRARSIHRDCSNSGRCELFAPRQARRRTQV